MNRPSRTGGQVLVQMLVDYGVRHAFCVPGESYLAALDAFYDHADNLQMIVCRQEGGASYMAEAYAKLTGEPGICFVSRGPGASNGMIGVHTAYQDSTPLLLFIGQVPRSDRGREAFQELDYQDVYRGVAKAVVRIDDADRLAEQVHDAWHCAISGRPGPVVIELPEDMLRDDTTAEIPARPTRNRPQPDAAEVTAFGERLAGAVNPIVIAGGPAWSPATNDVLATFVSKHQLPVACAFRRQDMIDNTHANYIGELGIRPNPDLARAVTDADLVIALGPRLGEMTSSGYTLFDVPEFDASGRRKLVHIFPSADELNSVYRADLAIEADGETFLAAVADLDPWPGDRSAELKTLKASYRAYMAKPRNEGAAVRLDRVMAFLRERLPADSIVTNGAGNYTLWAQRNYEFSQPRTQLACTNGSMGYGVPSALAAQLVRPASTVVSFSGDGCFLMNGQELATAVQYDLAVIFLVINNNRYGTIRMHQEKNYPGRRVATALNNPDFAALARAYGAFGATVRRTEEFEAAFDAAVASCGPALIELQTDY